MKKVLVFAAVFALLASALSAEVFVTGHAGYSALALDDAKSEYKLGLDYLEALFPSSATKNNSEPDGALFAKLDIMVPVLPFVNLGPRLGVISAMQSRLNYTYSTNESKSTIDAIAVPVMLGANISIPLGSDVSLNASAFGGYALGFLTRGEYSKLLNVVIADYTANYSSGALALDFSGGIDIKLANFIKAGINIGYRTCKFAETKASQEAKYNNVVVVEKDELLEKMGGGALVIDMSGLDVGLGITIIF